MTTDTVILIVRIFITLTFFIIAIFGPYALRKLTKFIRRYEVAHTLLESRTTTNTSDIAALNKRLTKLEEASRDDN